MKNISLSVNMCLKQANTSVSVKALALDKPVQLRENSLTASVDFLGAFWFRLSFLVLFCWFGFFF